MKKYISYFFAVIATVQLCKADAVVDYATGRKDEALKATLKQHYTPETLPTAEMLVETLKLIDGDLDRLTGGTIDHTSGYFTIGEVMPSGWLKMQPQAAAAAARDLNNVTLTFDITAADRGDLPLCDVADATSSGTTWSIGYSPWGESEMIQGFEPAPEFKGDLARAMFYAATVYSTTLWYGWGGTIFNGNHYPTFRNEAIEVYLKWHREDPIDNREAERDRSIAEIQGTGNPFVTHPVLAEYLWGTKKGEAFRADGKHEDSPEPDDPERNKQPLRKTYTAQDRYIDLYSPYIPDGASWTLDGSPVNSPIETEALTEGKHELKFSYKSTTGKLIIIIER